MVKRAKKGAAKSGKRPAAKKRATAKKAAPKKAAAKKAVAKALVGGPRGCCTITGLSTGPNRVFPHVTQQRCNELADQLDGIPHWIPGECA
jgi:hypothetical protein